MEKSDELFNLNLKKNLLKILPKETDADIIN